MNSSAAPGGRLFETERKEEEEVNRTECSLFFCKKRRECCSIFFAPSDTRGNSSGAVSGPFFFNESLFENNSEDEHLQNDAERISEKFKA